MKIAVCINGQARTWKKCYPRWMEILASQGEIDFFFHMWNYNTLPSLLATHNGGMQIEDELLSEIEINEILDTFKPKKYIFEPRKPIEYWNSTIPKDKQFGSWSNEQFYSLYYSSLLKREYELENDFRYDIVIRLRTDIWFLEDIKLAEPAPNTLYTAHCSYDPNYSVYRIGDIFFYADSHTFDQVCEFFKFLTFVPTDWVTQKDCPPPE
ncbi:MAG: hypothetical protein ACO3UU_16630, partial [Minisyncoccia bacterium]